MTRHLEVLVEEESMELTVRLFLAAYVSGLSFDVHNLASKQRLLLNLQDRLRGYRRLRDAYAGGGVELGVLVLVDRDDDDCRELKRRLEGAATEAGFRTRGNADASGAFTVVNRVVCEELESWFLGDPEAVRLAYPRVRRFETQTRYRHCDEIAGGTWEAFERLLQRAGHHVGGLAKLQAARDMAPHLHPGRNRSPSFQAFWTVVEEMAA